MKVCTTEHISPGFGTIPVGSLWADDSPYVVEVDLFDDVPAETEAPAKAKTVRKFGQKEVTRDDPSMD